MNARMRSSWPTKTRGFTLIEILITLVVLILMLGLYAATVRTAPVTRVAQHQDIALRIASTEIDSLRNAGYGSIGSSTSFSSSLLSELPSGSASTTVTTYNAGTKEVQVGVSWKEPGSGLHYVTLTTLITQTGGL